MKKRTGLFLVLIAVCLATFFGYRMVKRLGTDTKAPTIHMNSGVQQISVQAPKSALLQGITAEDDTDGDVTASLVVESIRLTDPHGKVTVSYAAFDRAGNAESGRPLWQKILLPTLAPMRWSSGSAILWEIPCR